MSEDTPPEHKTYPKNEDEILGSIAERANWWQRFSIGESSRRHRKRIQNLQNDIRFCNMPGETEARLLLAADNGIPSFAQEALQVLKEWAVTMLTIEDLQTQIDEQQKEIRDLQKELEQS